MNEIQRSNAMGAGRMTSLEIAEVTGKNHFDLLRAIRKMELAWEKTCKCKFALTSRTIVQPNGGTREVPCYLLTKTECLYIATKFNDEARAKLVIRWQQLEQERLMQQGVRHLLITDQDVMHEAEMIIGRTLVSFNQNADGCITASDIAEALGMAQDRLFIYYSKDGKQKERTYLVWTTKGAEMIDKMIFGNKH